MSSSDIIHTQTLHKKCERALRSKCRWEAATRLAVVRGWGVVCDKCLANMRKPKRKAWKNPCESDPLLVPITAVADRLAAGCSIKEAFKP